MDNRNLHHRIEETLIKGVCNEGQGGRRHIA